MTGVSPDLNRLVMRCLQKDPTQRFQTAHEVRAEIAGQRTVRITSPTPTAPIHTRAVRPTGPRDWHSKAGIALLLSGAALTVVLGVFWLLQSGKTQSWTESARTTAPRSQASLQTLPTAPLKAAGYVTDRAGVIDPDTRAWLDAYCFALEERTGAQLAILTVPDLAGESIEDLALRFFKEWGVGRAQKNDGVLLVLAINDRRSRVTVGYGLEPLFTASVAGGILAEMRPALAERRYGQGLKDAAMSIASVIEKGRVVKR